MKTLILVDSNAVAYRAFYALPALSNSHGEPTGAVLGFIKAVRRLEREHRPSMLVCVFDSPGPTFRHALFADYKIDRPGMPDPLAAQLPVIRRLLEASGIPVLEESGLEADDIIAALARRAAGEGFSVGIATADKDLLQLVSESVRVIHPGGGPPLGPAEVEAKFGFSPEMMPAFLALAGDASDGIPGVRGIGAKTALRLISRFGGLAEIYRQLEKVEPESLRRKLEAGRESAFLGFRLADLGRDEASFPGPPGWDALERREPDRERLAAMLERLEFRQLLEEEGLAGAGDGTGRDESLLFLPDRARGETAGLSRPREIDFEELAASPGEWLELLRAPGVVKAGTGLKDKIRVLLRAGISGLTGASRAVSAGLFDEPGDAGSPEPYPFMTLFDLEIASALVEARPPAGSSLPESVAFLSRLLSESGTSRLFEAVEMPLLPVLAEMEEAGIFLDRDHLAVVSRETGRELEALEKEIFSQAGGEFNLNSPAQVARVLFTDLGLAPGRRTKSGFSTDTSVLRSLSGAHPVVPLILRHRHLARLASAYLDSLGGLVDPRDGRLRTTFNQAGAATGRLSSEKPNLQNIPAATPEGARIRRAFRSAGESERLVSFDYSQVELRLVAHFSGDETMCRAFGEGRDIHRETARALFPGDPPGGAPDGGRRLAKAVNFGVLYGQGAPGLSRQAGIGLEEARRFIELYFGRFPGVASYFEKVVSDARRDGFVTTIMGRRRLLPGLNSPRPAEKAAAERMAVNTPVQGSAADIIKLAMVRVSRLVRAAGLPAKMLLQVHDELLFECPAREVGRLVSLVVPAMQEAVELRVPLVVTARGGLNWADLEPVAGREPGN